MSVNTAYLRTSILALCLFILPIYAQAEADTAGNVQPLTQQEITPKKGLSQLQVASQFGSPVEKLPPVGNPPITRWKYKNFTVYFEHQTVIHSVVHH